MKRRALIAGIAGIPLGCAAAPDTSRSKSGGASPRVEIRPVQRGRSLLDAIPSALHADIASGRSTIDLSDYFATALREWKSVYVPPGTYTVKRTIALASDNALVGAGGTSRVMADNVDGPAIAVTGAPFVDGQQVIDGFRISGKAAIGIRIDGGLTMLMNNISLNGLTCENGFVFQNTFGSTYSNLWTNGASIANACFLVGQAFNANTCQNWYSSNKAKYGLYIDQLLDGGKAPSHGSTWISLCLQSSQYGIWIGAYQGATFHGTYLEDIVHPVRLGDAETGRLARGICFVGGDFQGPYHNHPQFDERLAVFDLDYAIGCSITGVDLSAAYGCAKAAIVKVAGDGADAFAIARVCLVDGVWKVHSAEVLFGGSGFTRAQAMIEGPGSGAKLRVTLAGSAIARIDVIDGGHGYAPEFCPVAIAYRKAFKCSLTSVMFNSGGFGGGDTSPLYPWIVRKDRSDQASGVTLLNDTTWRWSPYGGYASLAKTDGGAFTHAVVGTDQTGTIRSHLYEPPRFP